MSFYRTSVWYKYYFLIIILSLINLSCSTDNSITGKSNQNNLNKPLDIETFFSTTPGSDYIPPTVANLVSLLKLIETIENAQLCIFFTTGYLPDPDKILGFGLDQSIIVNDAYDFRDNYLLKSQKGQKYTLAYYLLSEYGIENNLAMKHSLEHLQLMNTGIELSQELQHGIDQNKILIDKSAYNDLKNITKIYRNSENHDDIDFILDYLEADVEKYYNKTKAEIAMDFE